MTRERMKVGAAQVDRVSISSCFHAIENSVFVVSSLWYLPPDAVLAVLGNVMTYNLATGGSCIVNASGLFTREQVFGAGTCSSS